MTTLYVLVGVPGSGKTTWVGHQKIDWDTTVWTSTDKFVEQYAQSAGKTYNEVFEQYMPRAVELMANEVRRAFDNNKTVIWDQTSTTVNSRAKKLRMTPASYKKIAVVFETPDPATHEKFLDRPGKIIPKSVVQGMIDNWEEPTLAEGFDEIRRVRLQGL
jgi:predicted kinase